MDETKKFTTDLDGKVIEIKRYVTGFDQEAIDAAKELDDGSALTPTQRANRKSFQLLVVSVDGNTDNTPELVLGLKLADYNQVVEALNGLIDGSDEAEKKSSSSESIVDTQSTEPSPLNPAT